MRKENETQKACTEAMFVKSFNGRLTAEVRRDLDRVIGTWNGYYCVMLLLLLLLVLLRLLNILVRVRLVLHLLSSARSLRSTLRHRLLVLRRRLVLSALLLLRRLCWAERNLNVGSRYR